MDSPKKASVKHLEFQLQREKQLTKELEEKCKVFHAQIAQLEQDKAELRREKVQLADEAKKGSRYEDRIHFLQKELEAKEAIITQERAKATEARAETEDVRFNANASIASWKQAEEQWIAEQSALSETIAEQKEQLTTLTQKGEKAERDFAELQRALQKERERCAKIDGDREKLERELKTMHEKIERSQNYTFDLEQKIYNLDLAGEKQKEALCLKDTEIKTLEAKIAKHMATEERMEQTINSLNDKINAAKMVNLEGKGENEKLLCDLADARKEKQRLDMQVESLKRDLDFASQKNVTLQRTFDELREKHSVQQEALKEKNVEVRKHELTISQLTMDLKRLESSTSEGGFRCAALETEISNLKDEAKKLQCLYEQTVDEKNSTLEEVKTLKAAINKQDEEMVLVRSQMEERETAVQKELENWSREVKQRQDIIQELTEQLGATTEKNALYHGKILEESEITAKMRHDIQNLRGIIFQKESDIAFLTAESQKKTFALEAMEASADEAYCFLHAVLAALRAAELHSAKQEEILCEQGSQLQELAATKASLQAGLTEAEERIQGLVISMKTLEESLSEKEARRLSSAEKRTTEQERNALLTSQLAELQSQLQTAEARVRSESAAHDAQMSFLFSHLEKVADSGLGSVFQIAEEWWEAKHELVMSLSDSLSRSLRSVAANLVAERDGAERRAKELAAFVEEVKASSNRKDISLAEKHEAQQVKIHALEKQLQAITKEKEQVSFQLTTLLTRFESEQKSSDRLRQETDAVLKEERAQREAAEKQCRKLRDGLEYEIKRKCEYKNALEEVKKLREEAEKNRMKEKEMAAEAIEKVNTEVNYWVTCFDKLKTIAEKCRRNGTHVPSVDPDTLRRLEAARRHLPPEQVATTLKEQSPNLQVGGPADHQKLKRNRVEFQD